MSGYGSSTAKRSCVTKNPALAAAASIIFYSCCFLPACVAASNGQLSSSVSNDGFISAEAALCAASSRFFCQRSSKCIDLSWRCDNFTDCVGNEDEVDCFQYWNKTSNGYNCGLSQLFWCNKSQECLSGTVRCDGNSDCLNGEDEIGCDFKVTRNTTAKDCANKHGFYCNISRDCLPMVLMCDGFVDCTGGGDEDAAICDVTPKVHSSAYYCGFYDGFWCNTSSKCVYRSLRCNDVYDCADGDDEKGCYYGLTDKYDKNRCANLNMYWCNKSNTCIKPTGRCDGKPDCLHNEDESHCNFTKTATSNITDCSERSGVWCNASKVCLPKILHCDRLSDCINKEDEQGCSYNVNVLGTTEERQCNLDNKFWCRYSRTCVPRSFKCDGERDCAFGEDEDGCPITTSLTEERQCYLNNKFWCRYSSKCISKSWKCDGTRDCSQGEDEAGCFSTTISGTTEEYQCYLSNKFWCSSSRKCVYQSWKCDGTRDCTYGEDEVGCSATTTVSSYQQCALVSRFWCSQSETCVSSSWRCDGYNDCAYGEDEVGCSIWSTSSIAGAAAGSVFGVALLISIIAGALRANALQTAWRSRVARNAARAHAERYVTNTAWTTTNSACPNSTVRHGGSALPNNGVTAGRGGVAAPEIFPCYLPPYAEVAQNSGGCVPMVQPPSYQAAAAAPACAVAPRPQEVTTPRMT